MKLPRLILLLSLFYIHYLPFAAPAAPPPNVILILADDLGRETLGCYEGASYATPRLDRMAAQGVRFANGHAVPLCTPTRISLMTGKYNSRNWRAFGILGPDIRHIGHWMTDAGYRSCIAGKWQLYSYNPPEFMPEWRAKGQRPEDSGFEEYFLWHTEHTEDKASRYADPRIQVNGTYLENTKDQYGPDLSVDYINDFIERRRDEPFFVYYPMALPHGPFQPTPDSPDWNSDRHKTDPKYYKDMVEYMDKMVGRILDKLEALHLRDNTLVIFLGDNGTPKEITSRLKSGAEVIGGKGRHNLRGSHVPFIISYPKIHRSGHVVETLADCNDIVPTIFEVCGIPLPNDEIFDGESLLAQIRGEASQHRDWLFFHYDPLPGARKEGFTLQRWAMDRRWKYDDITGKLYDLIADPEETTPIDPTSHPKAQAAYQKLSQIPPRFPPNYTPWTQE